jgi:hypothetical protein
MSDNETGATLYTIGLPATACATEDQLRGWLAAANLDWWQGYEAVNVQWTPAQLGKRLLCTGRVDQETRRGVIIPAMKRLAGGSEAKYTPFQQSADAYEDVLPMEQRDEYVDV